MRKLSGPTSSGWQPNIRYGYRRVEALLRDAGWRINHKRVERIWRQEYNTVRPHSSLGYRPPAPEAIKPLHFDPFWLSSSKENIAQALT